MIVIIACFGFKLKNITILFFRKYILNNLISNSKKDPNKKILQ